MSAGNILDPLSPIGAPGSPVDAGIQTPETPETPGSPGGPGSPGLEGPSVPRVTSTPMRPQKRQLSASPSAYASESPSQPHKRPHADYSFDREVAATQPEEIINAYKLNTVDGSMYAPQDSSPPLKRLVLRKLVLKDFKSYAGTQTVGPFNDSFSAVVGPNGSGKSNVIDSLLFVFGFRSSQLRHANVVGLIHSSADYSPNECSVEVHFCEVHDHEDGLTEDIPDSELVISRRVVREPRADSYYINSRKSTKAEIVTTLLERGIDLNHKRFLILQGEVESIAMMKPKGDDNNSEGLLEYLEDIIGSSRYVDQISAVETELHAAMEVGLAYDKEFSVAQARYHELDRQRAERLEGNACYNRAQLAQYKQHKLEVAELRLQSDELGRTMSELEEQLKELGEQDAAAHAQLKALEKETATNVAARQELAGELEELGKRSTVAKVEMAKAEASLRQLDARRAKAESDLKERETKVSRAEKWLSDFDGDLAAVQAKQATVGEELDTQQTKLEKIRAQIHAQTAPIVAQIEQKQLEAEPAQAALEEAKLAIRRGNEELRSSEKRAQRAIADRDAAKATLKTVAERGEHIVSRKKELAVQLEAIGGGKEGPGEGTDVSSLEQKVSELRAASSAAQSRLQEAQESASKVQSQGRVGDALTQFSNSNKLEDFYGRLGGLGSIDPKYDAAVSTACPRLDFFVCGSVQTAQKCMEFLRRERVGRASFIVLDQVGAPQPKNPAHKAPRLFDLIRKREPKFDRAFFFATGQTLVTETLKDAREAAFSGPRVKTVSHNGEVVDVSGAMTGGGRPMYGKMGATIATRTAGVSRADLERIRQEATTAHQEFVAAEQQLVQARSLRSNSEDARRALQQQLAEVKGEVDDHVAVFAEHKAQYATEKAACAEVEAREERVTAELRAKLAASDAEVEALQRQVAASESAVAALREQILSIGGVELRECDAKVRDCNERVAQLKAQERDMHQEKRRLTAALASDREDCEQLQHTLKRLLTERAELEAVAEEFAATVKEVRAKEQQLEQRAAELDDKIQQLEQQAEQVRGTLGAQTLQMQQVQADMNKTNMSLHKSMDRQRTLNELADALEFLDLEPYRDLVNDVPVPQFKFCESASNETREALDDTKRENMELYYKSNPPSAGTTDDTPREYAAHIPEYQRLLKQHQDQQAICLELQKKQQTMASERHREFMAGFTKIKQYLRTMYRQINNDGQADLEFVDSQNPFMGVEFTVQPPGKSWKNISNLSGGEKTLSSLSLVFALHQYKPTPLYVMDEIDAALDIKNVDTIARYITRSTKCGQFVVISLRSHMFEKAQRMIGVYKWKDRTESATFDP